MRRYAFLFLLLAGILTLFCACDSTETPYYQLTFVYGNDTPDLVVTKPEEVPAAPQQEGLRFLRWLDENDDPMEIRDIRHLPKGTVKTFYAQWEELERLIEEEDGLGFTTQLPILYINTAGAQAPESKTEYLNGLFTIEGAGKEDRSNEPIRIRARGNFTYDFCEKKAYRIKFETPVSLFGCGKNRDYVLLADYLDPSHLKNYAAYTMAKELGSMEYAPLAQQVCVVLNGKFTGLYLLSQHTEVAGDKIDIKMDTTGRTQVPFFVEMDDYAAREGTEGVDYFSVYDDRNRRNIHFVIKYPENPTSAQFQYIKQYVKDALNACRDRQSGTWTNYFDADSLIDYFLINQLMLNGEIVYKSVFFSKSLDGKIKMGPVWDFDWGIGGPICYYDPYCKQNYGTNYYKGDHFDGTSVSVKNWCGNIFYDALLKNSLFCSTLKARFTKVAPKLQKVIDSLPEAYEGIRYEANWDIYVWNRFAYAPEATRTTSPYVTPDYQANLVYELLNKRMAWMKNVIPKL